jgi:hypothetical protein
MNKAEREQEILNAAIAAVNHIADIKLRAEPATNGNQQIDAEITIKGYKKAKYAVQIKKWAAQANFGALVNRIKQLPGKGMLVADYVNPMMGERLRENGIQYIDTLGNAYINEKPLYIFVRITKGQANADKNLKGMMQTGQQGRAFQPTGLKIVYLFLTNTEMLNAPYREIADKAEVALGTVGRVINDLKQGGFLIEIGAKNRRLQRKHRLLDKWVDGYLEKLRPKLKVGTYRAENPQWWNKLGRNITRYAAKWGGEVVAHEMTGYLKPQEITVYLEAGDGINLFKENRFRKDPDGDIHVYRAFWGADKACDKTWPGLVDPLIAYADLVGTGDARNLEAAEELLGEQGRLIEPPSSYWVLLTR